jgi:hypothetical protein
VINECLIISSETNQALHHPAKKICSFVLKKSWNHHLLNRSTCASSICQTLPVFFLNKNDEARRQLASVNLGSSLPQKKNKAINYSLRTSADFQEGTLVPATGKESRASSSLFQNVLIYL